MSSGRSSQVVACFSVDFTKYLMFSKSMPDRSRAPGGHRLLVEQAQRLEPQVLSIHSGSFLRAEMSRTTSSDRPRARGGAGGVGCRPSRTRSVPRPFRPRVALLRCVVLIAWPFHAVGGAVVGAVECSWRRAGVGMKVVQTCSPWASVARRWTCTPSSRENASVSASQSCGELARRRAAPGSAPGTAARRPAGSAGRPAGRRRRSRRPVSARGEGVGAGGRRPSPAAATRGGVALLELARPAARRTRAHGVRRRPRRPGSAAPRWPGRRSRLDSAAWPASVST